MPPVLSRWTLAWVLAPLMGLVFLTSAFAQAAGVRAHEPGWVASTSDASRVNPLANRAGAVAGGRKIFQQRCSGCHGDDGRGSSKAPDLTQADVQAQTDGALFGKITGGNSHAGMPAFSFLPAPQRWQLVLQLRAMSASTAAPR